MGYQKQEFDADSGELVGRADEDEMMQMEILMTMSSLDIDSDSYDE